MDEIEMQKQRLLLDDDVSPQLAARQPLDLKAPRSSGKTKRSSLTPARFCFGCCFMVSGIIAGAILYGLYRGIRAMGSPHRAHHADATLAKLPELERDLVRPFFGPEASGGRLQTFDLGLIVHAHWNSTYSSPPAAAAAGIELAMSRSNASDGVDTSRSSGWQEVHRSVLLQNVALDTQPVHAQARVTLPRDILPFLIDPSHFSEIVASFVMLPPFSESSLLLQPDETLRHFATVNSTSIKPLPDDWQYAASWLPYEAGFDANMTREDRLSDGGSPLTEFLSRAAVHQNLRRHRGRTNQSDSSSPMTFDLRTRSWVTSARDYPVYNLTNFASQMSKQKEFLQGACAGGRNRGSQACWRTFSSVGHFEHLLRIAAPDADDPRHWYAPFLATDLATTSHMHYVPLPVHNSTDETPLDDFTFDYDVAFSTSSLRKLGVLSGFLTDVRHQTDKLAPARANSTAHDLASHHDSAEFWNALSGHLFEPGSRPVVRGAMGFVAELLSLAAPLLMLYFWMTRSLTTGISTPAWSIGATTDIIFNCIFGVRFLRKGNPAFLFVIVLGFELLLFVATVSTALRLEWSWGGPLGWLPVGLGRRRMTHSERASSRADAKFRWRDRIILFAVYFLACAYLPELPQIVSASPPTAAPSETDVEFRVLPSSTALAKLLIPLLSPFTRAVWLTVSASQLHLNWRRRTFGLSKTVVTLHFASALLDQLPAVLHPLLGRAQLMDPLTVAGVFAVAVHGAFVYQAWSYPAVAQEEAEDE